MKSERIPVAVDPGEKAEIRRRAEAHGVPVAVFMRKAALGVRGAPEDDPDAWWDSLSLSRKKQVRAWLLAQKSSNHSRGQLDLLDELNEPRSA